MTKPVALGDAISAQVRRYRNAKGLSVRALSEECTKLGMPSLTEASLRNIERKSGEGNDRGRRRVSVEELVVLAEALGVPPVVLAFPVDDAASVEVRPGLELPTLDALRWFTAEGPPAPDDIDRFHGIGEYDPKTGKYGFGRRDPLTGLYEWYATDATWEQGAAPVLLLRQFVARVSEWFEHAATADVEQRQRLLSAIHATIAEMRRRGMPPPPLPPALGGPRKEEVNRGGSDQED